MLDRFKPRSSSFNWQSRQDLYDHFKEQYDIGQQRVDEEIENAMEMFKLRKHRPINPMELWEKVGRNLEKLAEEKKWGPK
ncbi:MAG: hypothetical protein ACOC4C_02140 [Fibrobacterota bacterium]